MMREIRWHGRGGQGAKSVAQILASAMLRGGYHVQAFPEYGPERSGAPLQAYTRYATTPIRLHCGVTEPDLVIVLDDSLLGEVEVTRGLKPGGLLLVNSTSSTSDVAARLGYRGRIVALDARALAAEAGARHGNVVMVGALAALEGQPGLEDLRWAVGDVFHGKLSNEVLEANGRALEIGYRYAFENEDSQAEVTTEGPDDAQKALHGSNGARPGAEGSELLPYGKLRIGAALLQREAQHPHTGSWRTEVKPTVAIDRCVNCLLCWVNCPDSAIVLHGTEFYGFDHDYCKGCELCAEVCPTGAIEMVTEQTVVPAFGRVEEVAS